jgi:excisionase family DNA binding protein
LIEESRMNQQPKLAYTVSKAARLLSLSRSFLYEAIQAGKLQSFKVWGARRISAKQLQDYLEKQERNS